MNKWKCRACDDIAVWKYIPANWTHIEQDRYSCAKHISRGCSCMMDEETKQYLLDPEGKVAPCIEHDYSKDGFTNAKYYIMSCPPYDEEVYVLLGEYNLFPLAWIMTKWFIWMCRIKYVSLYKKES